MNLSRFRALALLCLLAACSSDGTGPQTGTISGTVTASGAAVPGAQVALPGAPTQTTDTNGAFTFTGVQPGSYTLSITLPSGYQFDSGESATKSVTVSAGQSASVQWQLKALARVLEVRMSNFMFNQQNVTVAKGTTVRWINDQGTHTVTPDGNTEWTSTTLATGQTFEHAFNTAGTFKYFCNPHRGLGMTGTVTVQ